VGVATRDHEAIVAARFDLLEARFKDRLPADADRLRAALERLGPIAGRRVLDLGCGKGRFAARLEEGGAEVVGLDRAAAMLRSAAASGRAAVRGSACRLPFPAASFDALLAVEVLEHLHPTTYRAVFREAFRALRPGGRFVVIDKNALALDPARPWLPAVVVKRIDERRGRWMYPSGSPVRERWFWPGQLARRFLEAGFADPTATPLVTPEERGRRIFRPGFTRRFIVWSARKPGESAP